MKMELWIISWLIFAISIVYWDMHKWEGIDPLSVCHNAEIRIVNDKPICTECKKYCEIKK